ncbi:MAG: sulfatase-like hydrolase/transferase, partial [Bacteroidales bacterium]|nr:sulfatase-like hydrolase/transferase [Bacteroidales bacterium]
NLTERLTTEAMNFIEKYKNSPFFVTLSYYDIHTPLQSTPRDIQSIKKTNPLIENAVYAAMIENLDRNIGRLTSFLKEEKLLDNTVVIFTSDNGAVAGFSDQNPYRAGKGSYYDGGVRVPLFIFKNDITNGERSNQVVTSVDILPTIAEFMDVTTVNSDGVSLVPLMYGHKTEYSQRAVYWHFPIYLEAFNPQEDDARDPLFRTRPGSAIRFEEWKLHEYFEDNAIELYNLKTDPGERVNLAEQYPGKVQELYSMLNDWRRSTKAPLPMKRVNTKILSNN